MYSEQFEHMIVVESSEWGRMLDVQPRRTGRQRSVPAMVHPLSYPLLESRLGKDIQLRCS